MAVKKIAVYVCDNCKQCPYKTQKDRRYGKTYHCNIEVSRMCVTYYVNRGYGKSEFCPLDRFGEEAQDEN